MIKIDERSYNSKLIRPRPLVHLESDGSLLVVATGWGEPEHAQRAVDEVTKYMVAAQADVEVTSPFEFLTSLPDEVNYVRTACLIANENLYRGGNKNEYTSGIELTVLFQRGSQIAWSQIGSPSILFKRPHSSLQPLSCNLDLSVELAPPSQQYSPLPHALLGLDPTCDIKSGHFHVHSGDQVLLLSSGQIASSLWKNESNHLSIPQVTQSLVQENPDMPFWLGIVTIE